MLDNFFNNCLKNKQIKLELQKKYPTIRTKRLNVIKTIDSPAYTTHYHTLTIAKQRYPKCGRVTGYPGN